MPSCNNAVIAAAGSGKTTRIINETADISGEATLVVTYTQNNRSEIELKYRELFGIKPSHVVVNTWFSFLLNDCIRPYQNYVFRNRVESICFVNGQSAKFVKKSDVESYFLDSSFRVYTDKISELAILCDQKSGGLVLDRLKSLYKNVYIDEVQDLAGWDLDLLKLILNSGIKVTFFGDMRQATYSTNNARKNKHFSGPRILLKREEWRRIGILNIDHMAISHRCCQPICDFSDRLYAKYPLTRSTQKKETGHDGIYLVSTRHVNEYVHRYNPQALRFDRRTKVAGLSAINFGESKGMTFDRVLIYPNGPITEWLKSGDYSHVTKSSISLAKLYVALTRARYSVGIVFDDECKIAGIEEYNLTMKILHSGAFYQAVKYESGREIKRSRLEVSKKKAITQIS